MNGSRLLPLCIGVLIDTWWNVNYNLNAFLYFKEESFNRYMVECEFTYRITTTKIQNSFNRYMVECEFYWYDGTHAES